MQKDFFSGGRYLPEIIKISEKKKELKKKFSKLPLASVDDYYLGIVKFQGRYRLHTHDRDEIFYVLDGKLVIEVEKRSYILEPGEAILIKKGEEHASMSEKETYLLVFESQEINTTFFNKEE